ncbi:atexp17,atexpa17,athexp alpha 1.13,expa17 [Trifolium repens]|nr:atexp17,atexpa17,athexp alpha 1.13,expa17 [Trifolium repens]
MERTIFICLVVFVGLFTSELKVASAIWQQAHATFYGGSDVSGTMGGPCGYGNLYTDVPQWCLRGTSITITATNFCPPNFDLPSDKGGWCNPPRPHFDMSQPAFQMITKCKAGIVPILYRKVGCKKSRGIRFTINGRGYFELVLISNVGGAGDISKSMSFRVQLSNGKTRTAINVPPSSWRFGQSFTSKVQF